MAQAGSGALAERKRATTGELQLEITRMLEASRGLVFKAWTEQERVIRWLGPEGFEATLFESEARPGGAWRSRMRSPDGKEYAQHGVVREISPPGRFVFTQVWDDAPEHETVVTVELSEDGGRTQMMFHQGVFETVEARDSHREGWSQSFDRLEDYLATRGKPGARAESYR
jgi:uncharacterized protein YndB with AHSA1/START domain